MRNLLASLIALLCISQLPSHAATTYRYVATYDGSLYLVAANGADKLELAKATDNSEWSAPAVSADGDIIAVQTTRADPEAPDSPTELFSINPLDGKRQSIFKGRGYYMPDSPVVLPDKDVVLLERVDKNGLVTGIYAVNISSQAAKRVVQPLPDNEFFYDDLIPSPSGKLLATTLGITAGEWISINDLDSGESYWRTDPKNGMIGFSGAVWSADSKSLFVSLYRDTEIANDSPGGLWKFDARTGRQQLWKYKNQSIEGIWSSGDQKVLAVERASKIDYIRATDGKLLFSVPTSTLGGICGVFFRGSKGSLICGSSRLAIVDLSGKTKKTYSMLGVADDTAKVRYSPSRNAIMGNLGLIDLSSGTITRFAQEAQPEGFYINWLAQDITR